MNASMEAPTDPGPMRPADLHTPIQDHDQVQALAGVFSLDAHRPYKRCGHLVPITIHQTGSPGAINRKNTTGRRSAFLECWV